MINTVIFGTGKMANAYKDVLANNGYHVLGLIDRQQFNDLQNDETRLKALLKKAEVVFICVSENSALDVIKMLQIYNGPVYCEKPLGKNPDEYKIIDDIVDSSNMNLKILLNRRYYDYIDLLLKENILHVIIEDAQDPHTLAPKRADAIGDNLPWANSVHLIDLALFITNKTEFKVKNKICLKSPGEKQSAITAGTVNVDYVLRWKIPGAWKITIRTLTDTYVLSPLEILHTASNSHVIKCNSDFKPGLQRLVAAIKNEIINNEPTYLPTTIEFRPHANVLKHMFYA